MGLLLEIVLGGVGHLQILVKGDALGGQLLLEVLHHLLGLNVHHLIGDVGLDAVGHLLHQGVLKGTLGGGLAVVRQLLAGIGLQLLQGVEFGHVLGELVVDGGDLLVLDLVDLHMEHHGLTGQLGGIVLGECDVDVLLLAGLHAHQLIFKAGDEAAGADLQVEVLTLAAVEGHAVVKALEVDVGGVALLDLALHADQTAVAVGHLVQTVLHVLVGDVDLSLGGLQALILAQSHLGIHGHGALEHHAVLAAGLQLHLGIAHDLQLLLLHGVLIGVGQKDIHCFFIEDLCAVHALDHLAGSLAGAEAGNADLAALLQVSLVDGGLKGGGVCFDGQCDLALVQFFTGFYTHFDFSSVQH